MPFIKKQSGVTLIELTVVLLVLVALAGVVVPYIGGTSSATLCKATDVTMQNVKKVIMERYYLDTLGYFPKSTKAGNDYNLRYLFEHPANASSGGWDDFNAETQLGWRQGGYLQSSTTLSSNINLDTSFTDAGSTVPPAHVNDNIQSGQIQVLDSWGRPLIIQVDTINFINNSPIAKLVSAGANAIIETPITTTTPMVNGYRQLGSDDRILYLNAPTPATDVNPSCDD